MTNRKYSTLLAYLVLLIIVIALGLYANQADAVDKPMYKTYIVGPGDTLWDIAKKYQPNKDPREVVYEIEQLNGITPVIFPGQRIRIPVSGR